MVQVVWCSPIDTDWHRRLAHTTNFSTKLKSEQVATNSPGLLGKAHQFPGGINDDTPGLLGKAYQFPGRIDNEPPGLLDKAYQFPGHKTGVTGNHSGGNPWRSANPILYSQTGTSVNSLIQHSNQNPWCYNLPQWSVNPW